LDKHWNEKNIRLELAVRKKLFEDVYNCTARLLPIPYPLLVRGF
jgi:hypothetical protein